MVNHARINMGQYTRVCDAGELWLLSICSHLTQPFNLSLSALHSTAPWRVMEQGKKGWRQNRGGRGVPGGAEQGKEIKQDWII